MPNACSRSAWVRQADLAASIDAPVQRLAALLNAYVEVAQARPELFRGAFLFVRPDTLPKPERGPLEDAPFAALLIAAIEEGQARGELRDGDPRLLAQVAWAGVHGCIALPANFDRLTVAEPSDLAAQMVQMLVSDYSNGLRPSS